MSARIYVASLSDYNAGRLYGEWFDLDQYASADDLSEAIDAMLAKSREPGAEEFAIHDYDEFAGFKVGEYDQIDAVFALYEALESLGADAFPFSLWADNQGYSAAEAIEDVDRFREQFIGETTARDYADEYVEDCIFTPDTPELLKDYFDYEKFARDMVISGDVYELTGNFSTYLFNSH